MIVSLEVSLLAVLATKMAQTLLSWQPLHYAVTRDRLFIWRSGEIPKEIGISAPYGLTATIDYFGDMEVRAPMAGRTVTVARLYGLDRGETFRAQNLIERL